MSLATDLAVQVLMSLEVDVDLPDLADLACRPPWMRDAACLEHPEVSFFIDRGGDIGAAKAVCRGCLVREPCLSYALVNGERFGVWGGTSWQERRHLRDEAA